MNLAIIPELTPFEPHCCQQELLNIANWWADNSLDIKHGGFVGEIDYYGNKISDSDKGIILNSRILWFFSSFVLLNPNEKYFEIADRAFYYLLNHFDDRQYGGVYWNLNHQGEMIEGKKQTYAQCFAIYALVAYYKISGSQAALDKALEYFSLLEQHAKDKQFGGYIECFSQQWMKIDDFRLSNKGMNLPKTTNTHLHVLEAYSALYSVAPNAQTESALKDIIEVFDKHIIDPKSNHLKLFFDTKWSDYSEAFSYGHDIEASWLIWESLETLGDTQLLHKFKPVICDMANTCLSEAIGSRGQLCDEFHFGKRFKSQDSYWWVQAEGLVGFLNAYSLTNNKEYLFACEDIWAYICEYHIDSVSGEWHWHSPDNAKFSDKEYKAGFWKAPYHNGRAMMNVCQMLEELETSNLHFPAQTVA